MLRRVVLNLGTFPTFILKEKFFDLHFFDVQHNLALEPGMWERNNIHVFSLVGILPNLAADLMQKKNL